MLKIRKYILLSVIFIIIGSAVIYRFTLIQSDISIELTFAGDIMLSRGLDKYLNEKGYDYPYENVKDIFLSDDLTIVNLECPITSYGRGANKAKRFVFKANSENAFAMKRAGIDLCDLANNHTMDYRSEGLGDTMDALTKAGIAYVGAGENASSNMSYIFEKNGYKVGILAYSLFPPEGMVYNENNPNINYLSEFEDLKSERVKTDLKKLKADFKIVYFHWGVEYEPFARDMQKKLARDTIDGGADFVVGTHPHVIQGSEVYNGKYIYYSIGNCVFDKQIQKGTDEGMLLRVNIGKNKSVNIKEQRFKIKKGRPELVE
ncbi:CapA family protein [Lachnoanaerobaculum umeaense]|jgi:hypothetical protein|uniref:CapA family protein n=1 Tax=Lachnoanaerobaculum umeaense TaxID=617123 RepID=A0A385Q2R8_9FIRM|nr:CapA family protein [Lachnoanaerobaculum umeaense]AYA99887.1 CapA family protein [Lachnoanaerobaculum umeaense]PZW98339.1 capsule synthesis protein PGA_cap [Lachnoanaerobaculum umeaense]